MIGFPCAKLNLGLHVGTTRSDGYHEIETLLYPLPCYDALELIPAKRTRLTLSGMPLPAGRLPAGRLEDNLVWRAYTLLAAEHRLPPVSIHLHKRIPTGAGLGGGSSDAAQMLHLLNQRFGLGLSLPTLEAYAAQLGSDVPFFIHSQPHIARGRGEALQPYASILQGVYVRVLVPKLRIETARAYAAIGTQPPSPRLHDLLNSPRKHWQARLHNAFEPWLFRTYPELKTLAHSLEAAGAWYTSVSGSGSAVYGLFETAPESIPNIPKAAKAVSPADLWCFTSRL